MQKAAHFPAHHLELDIHSETSRRFRATNNMEQLPRYIISGSTACAQVLWRDIFKTSGAQPPPPEHFSRSPVSVGIRVKNMQFATSLGEQPSSASMLSRVEQLRVERSVLHLLICIAIPRLRRWRGRGRFVSSHDGNILVRGTTFGTYIA